ncbi:MAG: AraC family transcriptional regulator [Verrucomicrobiae bacterium]|nr:AraC family transcriptional regulator [Verrucomicrobiae bacterium]
MCKSDVENGMEEGFPFRLLGASHGIADARTPAIRRRDYESCTVEFIYEGSGYLRINGHSCAPAENSLYILHKRSTHEYWPEKKSPWKKVFFVADGRMMDDLFRAYRLDQVYHVPDCPQLRKYFDEMILLNSEGGANLHSRAAVIFHRFVEETHRFLQAPPDGRIPEEVIRLKNHLDASVEQTVSLEVFCRKMGWSDAHMIRLFRQHWGTTPYAYLMDKRIEMARLLIRHSALSIKEVSARLKFSDQYYFSNYFKRRTGLSPRAYRRFSGR